MLLLSQKNLFLLSKKLKTLKILFSNDMTKNPKRLNYDYNFIQVS